MTVTNQQSGKRPMVPVAVPGLALTALAAMSMCALIGCSVSMDLGHSKATTAQQAAAKDQTRTAETMASSDVEDATASTNAQADANSTRRAPVINVFGEVRGGVMPVAAPRVSASIFKQQTFADVGFDGDEALDPTGKWMVFSSTRNSDRQDLYLQRSDAASVMQLTSDGSDNCQPAFSPDGKRIAFASNRDGCWHLYVMDTEGRKTTQLTDGTNQDLHPSFSPDGQSLVFCSIGGGSGAQWELQVLNLSTLEKKTIGHGLFPNWCPVGSSVTSTGKSQKIERIAFQRARARGSRWFSLWTVDVIDGEPCNFTEVAVSTNAAIVSPSWSPDGQRLAFATIVDPAKVADSGPKTAGQQDIWTVNVDGTNRRRLTEGSGVNLQPCWAADNRLYFVSDRSGHECVWSVAVPVGGTATGVAAGSSDRPGVKATGAVKPPARNQDAVGANEAREVTP